jgi:prepilin signal peptidase PulO-like enzyme (type II secretory pathway)
MISFQTTTDSRRAGSHFSMTPRQTHWAAALALPLVIGPVWCLALQSPSHRLGTLSGFVLLAVLAVSAVTDAREHRIYNCATYSAVLWALLINVTASILSGGEGSSLFVFVPASFVGPQWLGGVGIGQSLVGLALCFGITLIGYHLSGSGAGDVKLAAAIGSVLGLQLGVYAVVYSYIIAAVAIVVWSIYNNGPLALVKAGSRAVGSLLGPLWPFPPSPKDNALLLKPIPLGPYFAIGTLLVVLELVPT